MADIEIRAQRADYDRINRHRAGGLFPLPLWLEIAIGTAVGGMATVIFAYFFTTTMINYQTKQLLDSWQHQMHRSQQRP